MARAKLAMVCLLFTACGTTAPPPAPASAAQLIVGTATQGSNGTIVSCTLPIEWNGKPHIEAVLVPQCTSETTLDIEVSAWKEDAKREDVISEPPEKKVHRLIAGAKAGIKTGLFPWPGSGKTLTVHVAAPCANGWDRIDLSAKCVTP